MVKIAIEVMKETFLNNRKQSNFEKWHISSNKIILEMQQRFRIAQMLLLAFDSYFMEPGNLCSDFDCLLLVLYQF